MNLIGFGFSKVYGVEFISTIYVLSWIALLNGGIISKLVFHTSSFIYDYHVVKYVSLRLLERLNLY